MDRNTALLEAKKIADVARAHADESEAGHRLAKPVVDAMNASGLSTLLLPTALGGDAAHPGIFLEVVETIAAGDSSAGWCAGINIGSNVMLSVIEPAAAKALLPDVSRGGMGSFAPSGQLTSDADGYHLTGRWGFGSNCQQAAYGALGFMRFENGAPQMGPSGPVTGMAFLPADDFVIDETWDMVGMRGTGSHDVVINDLDLADAFVGDLFASRWPDDALFHMRMFDVLGPSLGVVPLGIGRAALDAAREHVALYGDAPQRGPKAPFGVDVLGQGLFGQAEMRLRAARLFMLEAVDESYRHAVQGDRPPREVSARIGLSLLEALAAGAQAVDTSCRLIGTAASREGSYLDRLRRDVQSAGAHVLFFHGNAAPLGRQAAGMHTVVWPFIPPD